METTMPDEATGKVLAEATIMGLDIPEALARMGNSPKIYMRIIHSFITNMPGNLEELATDSINAETLPDYAVKIHGAKGSCYGIGANAVGDKAQALERAAKAGDLEACLSDNDSFIASALELVKALEELEAKAEAAEGGGMVQADRPDTGALSLLLAATRDFDIEQMGRLVEDLTGREYAADGDVADRIKDSFDAFDYQAIEEAIADYLSRA